ncbi:aspartic peptidase domain-containing protein [Chaetomidium leptoderma]|uniref:Aspartic peptidase domain-containing protein n=1 Tax=Chaetomidium leptoderma TaxID=669021 RepID=A0AAN6VQV3_9PEZI|nr:aspartic peptidase domain-containing protein [Chaetomidium leptoderma]
MSLILFHFLLLLLWTPFSLAAPSRIQKRSFKVDRVRNPNFKRHDGPRELLKAYQKYRMPIPQELLDSLGDQAAADNVPFGTPNASKLMQAAHAAHAANAANAAVGSVSAFPANNGIEYISPIQIGGQTINVALDSGSADLWVFSTQLPALSTAGHQAYDPLRSPTFKQLSGANFSIVYGDGTTAAGNVGTDTVDVGGAIVTGQAVQMATTVSTAFVQDTNLSGLLGLAFSQLSTVKPVKPKTFFENVMPSLAAPLFTADLRKDAVGSYEFGRIDGTKFEGKLGWIPATTSLGFWQVSTSGFTVGKRQKKLPTSQAIVDTGTTLMLVSKELSDGYYRQVPGAKHTPAAGGMTFPCNTTLPDLLLDVGGVYTARIRGPDINFGLFNGDRCFGGIQRTVARYQIWGDVFFRSQFVVFHGGNRSLGMALHA